MRDAAAVEGAGAGAHALSGAARLCALSTDACIAALAAFTVAANVSVWLGLHAGVGLTCAGLALIATLVAGVAVARLRPALRDAYFADLADEPMGAPVTAGKPLRALLALAPALAIATFWLTHSAQLVWAQSVLMFALALWLALRSASDPVLERSAGVAPAPASASTLALVSFACAALALLVLRPRTDDAFYLNMAVSAVDFPNLPLLSLNTLHGVGEGTGLPVQRMFAPYRVHSFELLGAWLARSLGIDAASAIHLGLTAFFSLLVPLALARLLRLLTPRFWFGALLVVLSFYWIEGTAPRGFANQAFVRLFNGKSVMLTFAVPLLCAYGLRFGAKPTKLRFAWLALAQIAAMGLSSTALWLAPTLAVIATAAATPLRMLVKRTLLAVVSASYVLAAGIWVAAQLASGAAPSPEGAPDEALTEAGAETAAAALARVAKAPPAQSAPPRAAGASASLRLTPRPTSALELVEQSLPDVLGPALTAAGLLAVFAWAAFLARELLAARLLAGIGLVVSVLFANPALAFLVERNVTGKYNYQRVYWLLPIPIALGLFATYGYERLRTHVSPSLSRLVTACALATFYLVVSRQPVISEANHVVLAFPPVVKLWPHARDLALEACKHAPGGRRVLAPLMVSHVLPTLHGCGHPLIADVRWMSAPSAERERRADLVRAVGSPQDLTADRIPWLIDGIAHYDVASVIVSREAVRGANLKAALRWAGFEKTTTLDFSQVWAKVSPASHATAQRAARYLCKAAPKDTRVLGPFLIMATVERARCDAPVLPTRVPSSPFSSDVRDAVELEALVASSRDLERGQGPWLAHALATHQVGAIAVGLNAHGNRVLLNELHRVGFEPIGSIDQYRLFAKQR